MPKIPSECLDAWTRKATYLLMREAESLVKSGRMEAALDLLLRSYLPLTGSSTAWVWRGNAFIYYDSVVTSRFHSVSFPALAETLSGLGFRFGVVVQHVRGYEESLSAAERVLPTAGPQCLKAVYLSHRVRGLVPASSLGGQVRIDWARGEITVADENGVRLFSYTFSYDEGLAGRAWPRPGQGVDVWPLAAEPPFNEGQAAAVLLQCLLREPLWRGTCDMPALL